MPKANARITDTSSFSGEPARNVMKKRSRGSMKSIMPNVSTYGLLDLNSESPRGWINEEAVKFFIDCGFTASKIATGAAR